MFWQHKHLIYSNIYYCFSILNIYLSLGVMDKNTYLIYIYIYKSYLNGWKWFVINYWIEVQKNKTKISRLFIYILQPPVCSFWNFYVFSNFFFRSSYFAKGLRSPVYCNSGGLSTHDQNVRPSTYYIVSYFFDYFQIISILILYFVRHISNTN